MLLNYGIRYICNRRLTYRTGLIRLEAADAGILLNISSE